VINNKIEMNLLKIYKQTNKYKMSFNIEEYLNSLSLDTTILIISGKNLTYLPDLSRFTKLIHLDCSYNYLIELPPLNNTLIYLLCNHNRLKWLPPLNNNLQKLYCYHNDLTWLPHLNDNLVNLNSNNNNLTWLPPLNHNLKYLNCRYNNIYNENIEKYKHNYSNNLIIKTFRNFKYTYYCLKYKKYFKKWLWEKVREPKIMAKYHPSHLNALEEKDDLEVFLDNWINK